MKVTASRVATMRKRADSAALAAKASKEKARGPATNADTVNAIEQLIEKVETVGGRHLALLERAGEMLAGPRGTDAIFMIAALGKALGSEAMLDPIARVLDGDLPLRAGYTKDGAGGLVAGESFYAIQDRVMGQGA